MTEETTQQQETVVETEEQRIKRERKERNALEKQKRREEQKLREKEKKKLKKAEKKKEQTSTTSNTVGSKKKLTDDRITVSKVEDFSEWFTQAIVKGEMIEYYDVSGCYILRPNAYQVWEFIRAYIDGVIKNLGVKNAMFPLFVTKGALEKEKEHVEGFSAEVAWVTKSGQSDLAEPLAIRPTSETIMYPAYAKWIKSHRDLPLKLNQWTNVVRWEFKHAVPFIRSREFLWQEGHTAFATRDEAEEEVYQILDMYRAVYEDLLAVPVVKGKKSETEKFAGGFFTTSVEAFIPGNGRAVQGATSHCLGQNFSKMFDIKYETNTADKQKEYAWQNSWGMTTRTIGVMIMVHGDDRGLNFPPRVAPTQIVVVPVYKADADNEAIKKKAESIADILTNTKYDFRVEIDTSEFRTPGWKYSHYEMKGVPLRIEVGPKDLTNNTVLLAKRYNGEKVVLQDAELNADKIHQVLEDIQSGMFEAAKKERDNRVKEATEWTEFMKELNQRNLVLAPWCDQKECEAQIGDRSKKDSSELSAELTSAAKSLCIPLEQKPLDVNQKCFCCGANAKLWCLFGRSY